MGERGRNYSMSPNMIKAATLRCQRLTGFYSYQAMVLVDTFFIKNCYKERCAPTNYAISAAVGYDTERTRLVREPACLNKQPDST